MDGASELEESWEVAGQKSRKSRYEGDYCPRMSVRDARASESDNPAKEAMLPHHEEQDSDDSDNGEVGDLDELREKPENDSAYGSVSPVSAAATVQFCTDLGPAPLWKPREQRKGPEKPVDFKVPCDGQAWDTCKNEEQASETGRTVAHRVRSLLSTLPRALETDREAYDNQRDKVFLIPFFDTKEDLMTTVEVIFQKVCSAPRYLEMWADFCWTIRDVQAPDESTKEGHVTFRRLLLRRLRTQFDNDAEKLTKKFGDDANVDWKYEAWKQDQKNRQYVLNMYFVSELFGRGVLKRTAIWYCIDELVPKQPDLMDRDPERLKCLCALLVTCRPMRDVKYRKRTDTVYDTILRLLDLKSLPLEVHDALQVAYDLKDMELEEVPYDNYGPTDAPAVLVDGLERGHDDILLEYAETKTTKASGEQQSHDCLTSAGLPGTKRRFKKSKSKGKKTPEPASFMDSIIPGYSGLSAHGCVNGLVEDASWPPKIRANVEDRLCGFHTYHWTRNRQKMDNYVRNLRKNYC